MRRRRVLIAGPLVALALASAAVARDPRAEQIRLKATDVALAKRIALKPSELGTAWTKKALPAMSERLHCAEFNPDFSAFTITGKARVAYTRGSSAQVTSSVEVYASRKDAVGDFKVGAKPAVATCLRRDLDKELAATGLPIRVTSARVVTAPRVGEQRIAYRIVARVKTPSGNANLYVDVIAFQRGRSIAVLTFMTSLEPYPAPARAAAAVAGRMR